jgi:MFS family permease
MALQEAVVSPMGRRVLATIAVLGFLSVIDTAAISPTIANYAGQLGAGEALSGLIVGIYSIVALPSSIIMGVLVDRVGRRRSLLFGLAWDVLAMLGYALATNPPLLLAVRMLHAVGDSIILPASLAIIGDLWAGRLGKPLSTYWVFVGISIVVASFTAAGLVTLLGFRPLFLFLTLAMLGGLVAVLRIRETHQVRGGVGVIARRLARISPTLILSYSPLLSLYLAIGTIVGALGLSLQRYLEITQQQAAGQAGIYVGITTLASLPVFPLVSRWLERRGVRFLLLSGLIPTALSQLLLVLSLGLPFRLLSAVLLGLGLAPIFVGASAVSASMNPEIRGASAGLQQLVILLGVAVGSPVAGGLLEGWGYPAPFIWSLAAQLAALPAALYGTRGLR